jgi:hypothetical protein
LLAFGPPPDHRQEKVSQRDGPRLAALGPVANDGLAATTRCWHRAADAECRVGNVEQVGDPEPAQLPKSETGQAQDECQVGFSWREPSLLLDHVEQLGDGERPHLVFLDWSRVGCDGSPASSWIRSDTAVLH